MADETTTLVDEGTTLTDTQDTAANLANADSGTGADDANGDTSTADTTATDGADTSAELTYELSLPEGWHLHEERVDEIAAYAKERGLSNEVAQEILQTEHAAIDTYIAKQTENLKQTAQEWKDGLKNDKEWGGPKYNKTVQLAKRAFGHFATPELRKELASSIYGEHPELIKTFARIGELLSDDSLITQQSRAPSNQSIEQVLYGETTPG